LESDAGFIAANKVMEKLGLSEITFDKKTSRPYEE